MGRLATLPHRLGSLLQSAAEEVVALRGHAGRPTLDHPFVEAAAHMAEALARGEGPAAAPPAHLARALDRDLRDAWECIRLLGVVFHAHLQGDDEGAAAARDDLAYGTCDPGWLSAILDYAAFAGRGEPIPYARHAHPDDFVLEVLPRNARVALVADWGTGTRTAEALLAEVAAHEPDVLVHLGDIYYAGTLREARTHFLDVLDRVFPRGAGRVPVYTLAGNHDMYAGGSGYYGILPHLNPTPAFPPGHVQPASYFSLRSPGGAWQLLALDTGLHDHDPLEAAHGVTWLEPSEEEWHAHRLATFPGRTILLSHHPLFSPFARIGDPASRPPEEQAANPRLLASWRTLRKAGGDVAAWFWGHEHNFAAYREFLGLARGRLIGHGAIPAMVADEPYRAQDLPILPGLLPDPRDPSLPLQLSHDGFVYRHGYTLLDLDDHAAKARARYFECVKPEPILDESF